MLLGEKPFSANGNVNKHSFGRLKVLNRKRSAERILHREHTCEKSGHATQISLVK